MKGGFSKLAPSQSFRERDEREREANKNDTAVHYLSINSPDLVMILVHSTSNRPSDRMTACFCALGAALFNLRRPPFSMIGF